MFFNPLIPKKMDKMQMIMLINNTGTNHGWSSFLKDWKSRVGPINIKKREKKIFLKPFLKRLDFIFVIFYSISNTFIFL